MNDLVFVFEGRLIEALSSTMSAAGLWTRNLEAMFAAHPWVFLTCAVFFGMCLSSFSMVIMYRLPRIIGVTIESGYPRAAPADKTLSMLSRSRCEGCGAPIGFPYLLPAFGWFLTLGRCRSCGAKISGWHPLVEVIGGILSGMAAVMLGPSMAWLWIAGLVTVLAPLAVLDWRYHWVPDELSMPVLFLALAASPFASDAQSRAYGAILAASMAYVFMWVYSRRRGVDLVSGGDIILLAAGGALVGLREVPYLIILTTLVLVAFYIPAVSFEKRRWMPSEEHPEFVPLVPVGPAICVAMTVLALFVVSS